MIHSTAAVLYQMGIPAPYSGSRPLVVEPVSIEPPGPGEVLIEVSAAGLCHSDLSVIEGSRPRVMPMVLGHEASGVVRETGPGVSAVAPGQPVVFSFVPACGGCLPCATGRPALCEEGARANVAGTLLRGRRLFRSEAGTVLHHHLGVSAFSRYTVAAQESLVPVPDGLPLETAALFGCAILTGAGAVMNTARVEPGASVAVFGLGGVGLSAVLGAAAAGAYPIVAIDPLPPKLALAKELGATAAVPAGPGVVEAIRDLLDGGADYCFECAGSEAALADAYLATRRGGTTITAGLPAPGRQFSVPAVSLVAEERTVKGSYMGSAVPRRDIPRFIALYRAGRLPVDRLLSRTIGIEEINDGFEALRTGEAIRQVVRFQD